MAESPEHEFLKFHFNDVLENFSKLRLYGFTETDRKKFDFSCIVERDWTRPLCGQVLWKHAEGIDKDIRTLLTDKESEIKVYLASDTVKHHSLFEETLSDYRKSGRFDDMYKLKPIWVPSDFDADKEKQRTLVGEIIESQIVQDILFNVVFGKLSHNDIHLFLSASGIPGLNLAILHNIATEGFVNISRLQKRLDVSSGPIREKLLILAGTGFVSTPIGQLKYTDTVKGRVFLDIISRLVNEHHCGHLSAELDYILKRLNCAPVSEAEVNKNTEVFPSNLFINLIRTIHYSVKHWAIDFSNINYLKNDA